MNHQRRHLSLAAAGLTLLPLAAPLHAQGKAGALKPGTDYLVLDKPAPTEAPAGKVEVVEFFWYNCPHCNAFEPTLESWVRQLPTTLPNVQFRRVPVAFNASFQPQQRLYYTLEAMGKVNEFQSKVFNAIHTQRQNLTTDDAIIKWAAANGLDAAKFSEQFKSFSTAAKVQKATKLQEAYQVAGVPSMGVAGRYYVDGELAKTMPRALEIVAALAAQSKA